MSRVREWTFAAPDEPPLVRLGAGPRPLRVDALPAPVELDLDRSALVVIDMQNDFCHPEGWLAGIGVDVSAPAALVPTLNGLTAALRTADVPVIWVNWGNRPDRANLPANVLHVYDPDGRSGGIGAPGGPTGRSDAVLTKGSWGAAISDGLHVDPRDIQVDKFRMSGFFDTPLDAILRRLDVTTLLFAGVNADQCVLATLTDAACLGYDCLLLEDASTTTSPDYCWQATLYNTRQCFGFTTTATAIREELAGPRSAR